MPPLRRRATIGAMLGLLLLTACSAGTDAADGLPSFTATTMPAASATPTTLEPPTPSVTRTPTSTTSVIPSAGPTGLFGDMRRNDIVAGTTTGATAAEKSVTKAWLAYWTVRAAAYFAAEVDPVALGRVSSGRASEEVIAQVGVLRQRKQRTVGGSTLDTTAVTIKGSAASVDGCLFDRSVDVDATTMQPAGMPIGRIRTGGTFQRAGSTWRVTSISGGGPCR